MSNENLQDAMMKEVAGSLARFGEMLKSAKSQKDKQEIIEMIRNAALIYADLLAEKDAV